MITRAQYAPGAARAHTSPPARKPLPQIREPYFFGYVRDSREGYGAETVRSGGLRVYTTIEPGGRSWRSRRSGRRSPRPATRPRP